MASSSVSQESLDCDDLVLSTARRSRVRIHAQRGNRLSSNTPSVKFDSVGDGRVGGGDGGRQVGISSSVRGAGGNFSFIPSHVSACSASAGAGGEHESPSRLRLKEKRCLQTAGSNIGAHKFGKPPPMMLKDKRKLREKRRSTGPVQAQSSEVINFISIVAVCRNSGNV